MGCRELPPPWGVRRASRALCILFLLIAYRTGASTLTYDFTADFDGRDQLIISGNTLQWQHFDNTPVGLHNASWPSTFITSTSDGTTVMNNVAWTASWPNGTGSGAFSSKFTALSPIAPASEMWVNLNVEQGRGTVSVVQSPSAGNNYTTKVEFNDNGFFSDALYQAKLTFTPISVIGGPVVNPANGHKYYLLSQGGWAQSQAAAVAMGGNLATVRNAAENAFIYSTFGNNRNLWNGYVDAVQETTGAGPVHTGNFGWVSGEPKGYTNWASQEPNDLANVEYNTLMWGNDFDVAQAPNLRAPGSWNDIINDPSPGLSEPYGVVEIVPEPSSSLALLLCGAALLRARRCRRDQ